MSLNKKGFVLIETLSVTVFAATIFVFLFKSVVPIMSIYDTKIDQIGNIDAAYSNYHIRQMIYNDECFNNKCDDNQDAIKNINYTMIRCDDFLYRKYNLTGTSIEGGDRRLYSKLYSTDFCNKLMEEIGGREKATSTSSNKNDIDHYWIFYVKGQQLDNFVNKGLERYNAIGPSVSYTADEYGKDKEGGLGYSGYGTQFGEETTKLFKDTVRDLKAKNGFQESDSYLIFYYWYINPAYSETLDATLDTNANRTEQKQIIPKYKDAISIVTIKSASENLYCYKFQVIPGTQYFYRNVSSYDDNSSNNYYFFYDDKYSDTKKYIGDSMEKCMNDYNGKLVHDYLGNQTEVLGSTTVRKYCEDLRDKNKVSFYNSFSRDSQAECEKDMNGKSVFVNKTSSNTVNEGYSQAVTLTGSLVKTYCENLLRNHNQPYAIYRFGDSYKTNCVHYFSSYDSIKGRSGASGKEGVMTLIAFSGNCKSGQSCIKTTPTDFCNNGFSGYNLGTIWDDFVNARMGTRGFDYVNSSLTPELAIVDYDSNCSKDVVIPEKAYNNMKITMIGAQAFKDKGIRSVKFNSDNIKIIDKEAFAGKNYVNLQIPSGVMVVNY